MRYAGHVSHMGERKGKDRVFIEKPEEKRPPGRPRCRCEDNIKMDLREVGAWTGLSWLRIEGHLRVWK